MKAVGNENGGGGAGETSRNLTSAAAPDGMAQWRKQRMLMMTSKINDNNKSGHDDLLHNQNDEPSPFGRKGDEGEMDELTKDHLFKSEYNF